MEADMNRLMFEAGAAVLRASGLSFGTKDQNLRDLSSRFADLVPISSRSQPIAAFDVIAYLQLASPRRGAW